MEPTRNKQDELLSRRTDVAVWFITLIDALSKVDFQGAAKAMDELQRRGIVVRLCHAKHGGEK